MVGAGFFQQGEPVLLAEMAQKAHDQMRRDTQFGLTVCKGFENAVCNCGEGDAAFRMCLGIKENFNMANVVL